MNLNITKYHPINTFKRNNTDCIICKIRNRLIKKSPEEIIRQAFVEYLILQKNIPIENIAVEYPMSRVKKGDKKRADIIVYGDKNKSKIILVVECKKENWFITDKDVKQAKYYSSILNSNCTIITNGLYHYTIKRINGSEKQISIIPEYLELLKDNSLAKFIVDHQPYERHSLKGIYLQEVHNFFIEWGHIGVDTNKELHPFITNLIDLLFDKNSLFENITFNGISILKDLGTVIASYGNAAGGQWPGEYKKFLIRDKSGNHQTIGIGIFAKAKFVNDKRFGNSKGSTTLIVSIDDYEKSHNSLQLNIDKNTVKINDSYFITHDGKLTNGKKGSVGFELVKNYVKINAPHLINNDEIIELCKFPDKKLYLHTDIFAQNLIKNLIEYSILRDEIRRNLSL